MTQIERLDLALNIVIDKKVVEEDWLFETLSNKFVDCEDDEAFNVITKLANEGYIYLDDDMSVDGKTHYQITTSGKEFGIWGGYTKKAELVREERVVDYHTKLNQRDLSVKQLEDYTSPRWTLYLGILAVSISGLFSALNYFANKPTNQINHLERRIDSLKSAINNRPVKQDTVVIVKSK